MNYEYKVFQAEAGWTGTYMAAVEKFLNDPSNYTGWEFIQVIGVFSGGASLLFRKAR